MKTLSYYTAFILGYALLGNMLYITVTEGFTFPLHNVLFQITSLFMIFLGGIWIMSILPKHFLALRYGSAILTMKTKARIQYGAVYQPLVSVIIPTYNEEVGIISTIKTLLTSTYPFLEILLIDDGSTDATRQQIERFLAKYVRQVQRFPLRYYYKPNGGKGSALNYGIQQSKGEIICTFDADCVVDAHCVERFVSYFVDRTVMACSGNIKIGNQQTVVSLLQYLEYLLGFQMKKAESLLGTVFVIGGAAAAYRREVFIRLGGYLPSMLTEDMELTFRMHMENMKILYSDDAIVYTEGPTTFRTLCKQRLRWKRGCLECLLRYRATFFSRTLLNRGFFWMTLPFTILQYFTSLFCIVGMLLVYWYCLCSFNFEPILAMIFLNGGIYVSIFWNDRRERRLSSFLLVPIAWCLFYIMGTVETYALLRAAWTIFFKQEVKWQKWQRQGVIN
jgi:biofilm PGA synthesis N-glycosyltransferase PgaC